MLLSSAYRANRSPRCSNSWSSSSSTMFDNKGDNGPPCGVPSSTGLTNPFSITPAVRNVRISFSIRLSLTPLGNLRHQSVVVDPIEELLQIQIHHPAIAFGDVLLRLFHRLMRRPPRTKPVAVFGKRPVPSALQNLHHRLLDKPIQHRRDAKLSHPSVRFRDLYPFYRLR